MASKLDSLSPGRLWCTLHSLDSSTALTSFKIARNNCSFFRTTRRRRWSSLKRSRSRCCSDWRLVWRLWIEGLFSKGPRWNESLITWLITWLMRYLYLIQLRLWARSLRSRSSSSSSYDNNIRLKGCCSGSSSHSACNPLLSKSVIVSSANVHWQWASLLMSIIGGAWMSIFFYRLDLGYRIQLVSLNRYSNLLVKRPLVSWWKNIYSDRWQVLLFGRIKHVSDHTIDDVFEVWWIY